jgi:U3 small nucleolar RNA-associated protein 12
MDQITYCMVSPDAKYLIYSMLDNSIRVFYEDTNKFFLNLYGHKLPVLCFDVSSDGALLISGSADKNIKLWGMDFGDCHKSFFAHQDSVTQVKFVKKTHYFFSASKDKVIRYWDADSVSKSYFNFFFNFLKTLNVF